MLHILNEWAHAFVAEYGLTGVALLGFTESFIQPLPIAMIITLAVALKLPLITTLITGYLANLAGAVFGYYLGFYLGKPFCYKIFKAKHLANAEKIFNKYGIWAVIVCGVSPLPFKVVVVLAGTLRMSFVSFILAAAFSRAVHFAILWSALYFGLEFLRFLL